MDKFLTHDEYCTGICDNSGIVYKFDRDDLSRIDKHHWWSQPSGVFTFIDGETVSMAKYILDIQTKGKKVLRRNGNVFDFRKENLYHKNIFHQFDEHYLVECFDGRCFKISPESYEVVSQYVWHIDKNNYVITKLKSGKIVKLHRLLLKLDGDDKVEVDHINRDTLDNTMGNLRTANRSLNCYNRDVSKYNRSGCIGVYKMHGYDNKWCSQINKDGKRYYLGSFDSYDEAVSARKTAENILY